MIRLIRLTRRVACYQEDDMTHEVKAGDEADHGPEHDHTLPDATDIPVHADPAESDAPPLED